MAATSSRTPTSGVTAVPGGVTPERSAGHAEPASQTVVSQE
jgi:hypothetical protein